MEKTYYKKMETVKFHVENKFDININEEFDKLRVYAEQCQPDWYGDGELIESFEREMAEFFYKEDAAFFISGTMAQQCMMRVYCDEKKIKKIAYHPTCHMEIHEKNGLKELHDIHSVYLGSRNSLFTIDDLKLLTDVACVVFELPQREIGGQAPTFDELTEMIFYLKQRDIKIHLDGARILEILPFYGDRAKEIFTMFDSIYMSYYKGLSGISGSILVGSKDHIDQAKLWRKRYGGTICHMYPYILSAKKAFSENKDKMHDYWLFAIEYAKLLELVEGIRIEPNVPMCNMFHVYFDMDKLSVIRALIKVMEAYNIALFNKSIIEFGDGAFTEVVIKDNYRHVPKLKLECAVKLFNSELKKLRKNK